MSKTISGYTLTIAAFMPCGTSAADHAKATATFVEISRALDDFGLVEIESSDKWAPKHKVVESSDG